MRFIDKSIELFFEGVSSVLCPIVCVVVFVVGFIYHLAYFATHGVEDEAGAIDVVD